MMYRTTSYGLSAEWFGHNVMHFIPWFTESTQNVGLDKAVDPRPEIAIITDILEFLGLE